MNNKKNKIRIIIVTAFILLFCIVSFINLRGTYIEYKELGENYLDVFYTNLKYKYIIFGILFAVFYILIYFTNRGIKKGLKPFFEAENINIPKLLNKSIAFIVASIISIYISNNIMEKILLAYSNASFGINDPIFGFDIAFYIFQKPIIEIALKYTLITVIGITAYMVFYYILVFNKYFNAVDGKMLLESLMVKKIIRNIMLVAIVFSLITILNTTNISLNTMITINNDIDIIGASYTDIMLQRWGYTIFSVIIIIFTFRAIRAFEKKNTAGILKNLAIIPGYLIVMFLVIIVFNLIFVNSNALDKQKEYLEKNIGFTKNAYDINIDEYSIDSTGTITQSEVVENSDIINNIKIVSQDAVLKTLQNNQTNTGYYSYRNANIANYEINGKSKLVYLAPREIINSGRTYNNKTYEYTHGLGQIVVDSTSVTDIGNIKYIQKDISGDDDVLGTKINEIYFGLETNNIIATNTKNKQEYDYTDEQGIEYTSNYNGEAGLKLSFIERLILGIKKGDLKLAFTNEITEDSKIIINRNIIKRAKKAMPYLIYDENPYTVVTEKGRIVWVIDGYTVSNQYPYSQFTTIEHDDKKEKINYIRNSVKVIVDSYDGIMKFYITDKTDPIIMAYRNIYPTLFEDINEEISNDISKHLIYPKYLYDVQAELLKVYHNVRYDVLYRTDDLWNFAKCNSTVSSKTSGTILSSYYVLINDNNENKIGLIQIYTPESKQNLISYLVGTTENNTNKLKLYKFSEDSNILGPMQLDNQIEYDETIYSQIQALSTSGTRVTKNMIAIPIDKTILYVESIYQTMLNEESKIPLLKKIVVASGNKLAIGDNLEEALKNLLSTDATKIEVENTDEIDGLIDAIVKANKNLVQSTENGDWELMGSDMKKLQTLIDSLEKLKQEEDKKKEQENNVTVNNKEILIEQNKIIE